MKLKKYLYKKVESTNNVALRLIKQGNQRGIILTDQQTKGKGQRKNKWISIKGNLFLSVFFEISKKISLSKIINLNLKIIKKIIYKKIIRIKPSFSDGYNNIGKCLAHLNDYENAAKYFKKLNEGSYDQSLEGLLSESLNNWISFKDINNEKAIALIDNINPRFENIKKRMF